MYAMVCTRPDLAYHKLVHVKFRKATLESSKVGILISTRDCVSRLGVSEIDKGEA